MVGQHIGRGEFVQTAEIYKGFKCASGLAPGLAYSVKLADSVIAAAHQGQNVTRAGLHDDDRTLKFLGGVVATKFGFHALQALKTFGQCIFSRGLNLAVQGGINGQSQTG